MLHIFFYFYAHSYSQIIGKSDIYEVEVLFRRLSLIFDQVTVDDVAYNLRALSKVFHLQVIHFLFRAYDEEGASLPMPFSRHSHLGT